MSCETCLDSACAWVPQEGCLASCDVIADVSCYTKETFPNNNSLEESCQAASDASADSSLCASQTDCDACTDDTLDRMEIPRVSGFQTGNTVPVLVT